MTLGPGRDARGCRRAVEEALELARRDDLEPEQFDLAYEPQRLGVLVAAAAAVEHAGCARSPREHWTHGRVGLGIREERAPALDRAQAELGPQHGIARAVDDGVDLEFQEVERIARDFDRAARQGGGERFRVATRGARAGRPRPGEGRERLLRGAIGDRGDADARSARTLADQAAPEETGARDPEPELGARRRPREEQRTQRAAVSRGEGSRHRRSRHKPRATKERGPSHHGIRDAGDWTRSIDRHRLVEHGPAPEGVSGVDLRTTAARRVRGRRRRQPERRRQRGHGRGRVPRGDPGPESGQRGLREGVEPRPRALPGATSDAAQQRHACP